MSDLDELMTAQRNHELCCTYLATVIADAARTLDRIADQLDRIGDRLDAPNQHVAVVSSDKAA
jgi:hypothetical protein